VSQFYATVCLPPSPPDRVKTALTAALAPFDMNRPAEGRLHDHQAAMPPLTHSPPRLVARRAIRG
jgi:hypothetical protein